MPRPLLFLASLSLLLAASRCLALPSILISVPEQKLLVLEDGQSVAHYPISTSRFGLGDRPRSFATPLGTLAVADKFGAGAPLGMVFKGRRPTGEVLAPNSPGRDPIVTRILRLRGCESGNSRAFDRGIYIHGTPVEGALGRPASYGCIRMRSADVIRVFDAVPVGTRVDIVNAPTAQALRGMNTASQRRLGSL